MRLCKVDFWPFRNNASWINGFMTLIIVTLNVGEIDGLNYTRDLIQFTHISPKVWVVYNAANVALKVPYINGIKSHQSCKQPPVSLC